MRLVTALFLGLIFGAGITFGGMINPAKVLNFFDIAGTWDPSLALVMGAALVVTGLGYHFVLRRPAPVFEAEFHLPQKRSPDPALIGGAVLFGIGWGIAGFCPGGAIPALGLGEGKAFLFIASMLAGIWATKLLRRG
ncbi:DUF6691 family protein [Falsigemmobacter faecalis]|uniref:YeeE/YedE family protein n=1 Tax=Falsigemmobacter faecalis TaxID=2488730 RepID=A0A3P3DVB3_9RHOB|nr:DUF6691 family protein [Falsigemmobacter faecalis]RRH78227.1 YeeE/YedE family protein [Falsigemmobacter faecalis]